MRIRRSRLRTYYWKQRVTRKDNEGSTYEEWGAAVSFQGESWPASGKVQAQQYGERLAYIRNLRIEGDYAIIGSQQDGIVFDFGDGFRIRESDGICIYAGENEKPDYRIISIKSHNPLRLELERI